MKPQIYTIVCAAAWVISAFNFYRTECIDWFNTSPLCGETAGLVLIVTFPFFLAPLLLYLTKKYRARKSDGTSE